MIIAERDDFKRYVGLNTHFQKVDDFINQTNLTQLEEGRIEIDGDRVFANCMTYIADGIPGKQFENHRKYIDIHLVINNLEKIAVTEPKHAKSISKYDEENDYELFVSDTYQTIELTSSNLLVTFEEDLHQPKLSKNNQLVKKLVIKVLDE
ncbi:beta-D-galactosidase [Staphylococcus schleiferi]|uniref:YhcH/YjgK/YiaL family protein n=1 Tax=Staphylococcus coagulans TaxID=74706 RepID=UPI00067A34E6|nr:YhcH/YjgK/YiaL family protein [Staphylococcus coagulans]AKS69508.1 beta-D-galactosidase [Staphylococcus schleiferi]AKS71678.1 beta-D-galactosidase [Staphylococcus schleiferi]AKS73913.1 beta-D-galactosidase [Staphylococcus schleiferi]MBT2832045.1 YhcH/YjgK/YiaL family protein [Staphylococcus coagulans]